MLATSFLKLQSLGLSTLIILNSLNFVDSVIVVKNTFIEYIPGAVSLSGNDESSDPYSNDSTKMLLTSQLLPVISRHKSISMSMNNINSDRLRVRSYSDSEIILDRGTARVPYPEITTLNHNPNDHDISIPVQNQDLSEYSNEKNLLTQSETQIEIPLDQTESDSESYQQPHYQSKPPIETETETPTTTVQGSNTSPINMANLIDLDLDSIFDVSQVQSSTSSAETAEDVSMSSPQPQTVPKPSIQDFEIGDEIEVCGMSNTQKNGIKNGTKGVVIDVLRESQRVEVKLYQSDLNSSQTQSYYQTKSQSSRSSKNNNRNKSQQSSDNTAGVKRLKPENLKNLTLALSESRKLGARFNLRIDTAANFNSSLRTVTQDSDTMTVTDSKGRNYKTHKGTLLKSNEALSDNSKDLDWNDYVFNGVDGRKIRTDHDSITESQISENSMSNQIWQSEVLNFNTTSLRRKEIKKMRASGLTGQQNTGSSSAKVINDKVYKVIYEHDLDDYNHNNFKNQIAKKFSEAAADADSKFTSHSDSIETCNMDNWPERYLAQTRNIIHFHFSLNAAVARGLTNASDLSMKIHVVCEYELKDKLIMIGGGRRNKQGKNGTGSIGTNKSNTTADSDPPPPIWMFKNVLSLPIIPTYNNRMINSTVTDHTQYLPASIIEKLESESDNLSDKLKGFVTSSGLDFFIHKDVAEEKFVLVGSKHIIDHRSSKAYRFVMFERNEDIDGKE